MPVVVTPQAPSGTKVQLTIAKRVCGIEPMDHPTDREIIAAARTYFRAADRMHA